MCVCFFCVCVSVYICICVYICRYVCSECLYRVGTVAVLMVGLFCFVWVIVSPPFLLLSDESLFLKGIDSFVRWQPKRTFVLPMVDPLDDGVEHRPIPWPCLTFDTDESDYASSRTDPWPWERTHDRLLYRRRCGHVYSSDVGLRRPLRVSWIRMMVMSGILHDNSDGQMY